MRPRVLALGLLFALGATAGSPASAHVYQKGSITITHPWARATNEFAVNGAAYLEIAAKGKKTDRLVAVESPVAREVKMFNRVTDAGAMMMPQVSQVRITPGQAVTFKPGGLHILLEGLNAQLTKGYRFPMTLVFAKAGRVKVQVYIEDVTTLKPPPGKGHP